LGCTDGRTEGWGGGMGWKRKGETSEKEREGRGSRAGQGRSGQGLMEETEVKEGHTDPLWDT
jgi:hypothetical protein